MTMPFYIVISSGSHVMASVLYAAMCKSRCRGAGSSDTCLFMRGACRMSTDERPLRQHKDPLL